MDYQKHECLKYTMMLSLLPVVHEESKEVPGMIRINR